LRELDWLTASALLAIGTPETKSQSREADSRVRERSAVPLKRLKEEYLEQDGVRFLLEDEPGSTVACRVSHEALHADRMHFSGTDGTQLATQA
jgi:hypothetical protein